MERTSKQSGRGRVARSHSEMSGWTQPRAVEGPWSADRPLATPGAARPDRSVTDAVMPLGLATDVVNPSREARDSYVQTGNEVITG